MNPAFNLTAAWPEIVLGSAACLILILDLFVPESRRQISYWLTQVALLAAAYVTLASPDDTPLRALGGMFIADKLADAMMLSANSFITLYLGLELMSLSLYALIALQRDSARAIEAAMKYFVLGALASGLLLYGMSMLYGATG